MPVWTAVSEQAKDFITCCLEKDRSKRITADKLRGHAWFTTEILPDSQAYTGNLLNSSSSSFDPKAKWHSVINKVRIANRLFLATSEAKPADLVSQKDFAHDEDLVRFSSLWEEGFHISSLFPTGACSSRALC